MPKRLKDSSEYIKYKMDRSILLEKVRIKKETVEKIVSEGIETEEEEILARGICSIVLSDLSFEEARKKDKINGGRKKNDRRT